MSKIKELKNITGNNLNFVDILELFSPEKKSKYTDTLLRLMNNTSNIIKHSKETKNQINDTFNFITKEDLEKFNPIQTLLIFRFLDSFFNKEDLINFRKFCEYNERGLINQNDLSKYKSFDEIITQLSLVDMKVDIKDMENQIIKIHEDGTWLLLRPLTYISSKKYGSNTKWCTTQESNPEYFFKYAKKGILIYCINKITGYKVASFYSLDKADTEFSYWNQKDSRIDSTQSELPIELIILIRDYVKTPKIKTNHFMLDEDMRNKENKIMMSKGIDLPSPIETEFATFNRPMRTRLIDAINRENVTEETNPVPELNNEEELNIEETIIDRMRLT